MPSFSPPLCRGDVSSCPLHTAPGHCTTEGRQPEDTACKSLSHPHTSTLLTPSPSHKPPSHAGNAGAAKEHGCGISPEYCQAHLLLQVICLLSLSLSLSLSSHVLLSPSSAVCWTGMRTRGTISLSQCRQHPVEVHKLIHKLTKQF